MNPLRAIAYLGIFILLIGDLFAIFFAFLRSDWYGVFITVAFLPILALLTHGLRAAAKRENHPELRATHDLGWAGESLSSFILGPVLHSPEGIIVIVGSVLSLLFAFLAWLTPSFIALNPVRSDINATLFVLWPILLFVFYVKICSPHFKSSAFTFLSMLCVAGIPFYAAYK